MFTKSILTALAITFAAPVVHAAENERPEVGTPRVAAQIVEVPAFSVLSGRELSRRGLAPLDLVGVTLLGDGTTPADRSSRDDS